MRPGPSCTWNSIRSRSIGAVNVRDTAPAAAPAASSFAGRPRSVRSPGPGGGPAPNPAAPPIAGG